MKKLLTLFAILAVVMLTPSCQNELLDALSENIACKSGTGQTGANPEMLLGNNSLEISAENGSKAFCISDFDIK